MNQIQLNHLIQKLYDIDKGLGGEAQKAQKAKNANEFSAIKDIIIEKLFAIQKKQNEKDEKMQKYGNDRDNIALGAKIRDELKEVKRLLDNLDETLNRQAKNPKKYPKSELQQNQRIFDNLTQQLENLMAPQDQESSNQNTGQKYQTLTEQKNKLMGVNQNRAVRYDLTKEEELALQNFEKQDQKMEDQLQIIIDLNDGLKNQAHNIGNKIDQTQNQIVKLNKEVEDTNQSLLTQNKQLKVLITKFRSPNKLCLDITLFLLFLGLIGVAYTLYKKGK